MPFISSVQGWANQPSIVELDNLLSNQEALVKQMSSKSSSSQEDNVLYTRVQGKGKPFLKQNSSAEKHSGTEKETRCSSKICYRCGKEGHIVKPGKNSIFLKNGKTIISVENWKFSKSRIMKRTSPLNSCHEI